MNIDDVLLTNNEADLLWEEYCESNPTKPGWERMKRKAQALKLLEWLKKDCLHGLVGVKRGQCSECMSELESKLKEG